MAILTFDIEPYNSVITTNTVSNTNINQLYNQGVSVLNIVPTPSYKGEVITCSNLGSSYKNSYTKISFNTSTITTDEAILNAKLLISGKLLRADDNATLDIYINTVSSTNPSYDVGATSLYDNTYQYFQYATNIKIGSVQFSSFPTSETGILEFVIPSYLLGKIGRACKTELIVRTNYAALNSPPSGRNELILGHSYVDLPSNPLKTQLVVEVISKIPLPEGPVVLESISAPQVLASFVEGGSVLAGGKNQFFTQSDVLKFATLSSKGFHIFDCSTLTNPTKVSSYSITESYPSMGSAGYTFDVAEDGSRVALPVLDATDTYRNKLLYSSGNAFLNGGGYGGSSWIYGGKIKVVKVGTRYFSINVNLSTLSITDISNFVIPDAGIKESIPTEIYPNFTFNKPTELTHVTVDNQDLVIFADKYQAKLYIINVTNPGTLGNLVSTCPVTVIDLVPYGYTEHITEYNSSFPTLRAMSIAKHPITNKVYVSFLKGWRIDNPDFLGYITDESNIKLEVFELENLSLVTRKETYVVKNALEGLSTSVSTCVFNTTKTSYLLFSLHRSGYNQDKPKIYTYDLEKAVLVDCSYVSLSSSLEQSPEIAPYFNSRDGFLYLYSTIKPRDPFLYIYKIGIVEQGVIVPPSGSVPTINSITFAPSNPQTNIPITIGVNATAGTGGAIATYKYDFGDTSPLLTSVYPAVGHTYRSGGSFTVKCTVTDVTGGYSTRASTITVSGDVVSYPVSPSIPRSLAYISDNNQITLSWLPPLSDGGAPIVQYNITKEYKNIKETITTPDALISYTFTGLIPGEIYTFSVAAINSASILGPYTQDLAVSLASSIVSFDLVSWKKVNGQTIEYRVPPPIQDPSLIGDVIPIQINSLSVKNTSDTLENLYESPKLAYAGIEEVGKFSLKTVFRREEPQIVGSLTYYKEAPLYKISSSYKLFIEELIFAAYPFERPAPYLTRDVASDLAAYNAFPGDIVYFYDYVLSTPLGVFDSNTILQDEWRYNIDITDAFSKPRELVPIPGWAYTYSHTRPFLLFNTVSISTVATILKVRLKAKYDNTRLRSLPNINTLYFKQALITSSENLTTEEYNNLSSSKGETSISELSSDIDVLLDPSIITPRGYTKIAVTSNLDSLSFPSSWNSITYKDVTLEITLGTDRVTVPSTVTNLSSSVESRKVTLSWDAPIFDGGSGITGYSVTNMNTGISVFTSSLTNRMYTFSDLENDTLYTFSVSARNSVGEGAPRLLSVTPSVTNYTPPSPVQNLEAISLNGAIDLSWNAPSSTGGKPITGYSIYNITKDSGITVGPSTYLFTETGLSNNTVYTYQVCALNTIGLSNPVSISATPLDQTTVPSAPTIVSLTTTAETATVSYVPTGDGGNPITGWYLKIINLNNNTNLFFSISDPLQLSYIFTVLHKDIPYLVGVASLNELGRSSWAYSNPFALTDEGTTIPSIKATIDYNYDRFYPAPVDLNLQSPNYLNYVYPETVYVDSEAYVQGEVVSYPVFIDRYKNKLYLNLSSIPYTVSIGEGQWTIDGIVSYLNDYFNRGIIPIKASYVNGKLILKTIDKGESITLNFGTYTTEVSEANSLLFGINPTFIQGSRTYLVENHVPTSTYDATEAKVLVESKPVISIKPYIITSSFVKESDTLNNTYSLQLPHKRINPNSINIHYYNDVNNTVSLRDYTGDGVLRIRVKEETASGDPISFTYLNDQVTNSDILGKINYEEGTITKIVFPTYLNSSNELTSSIRTPVVVGTDVQWPVFIPLNSFLYVSVNGITYLVSIPQKINASDLSYALTDIINVLNDSEVFRSVGLIAGNVNGQLYIKNVGYNLTTVRQNSGPEKSLLLMNSSYTVNSANFILFGLRPRYIGTSPFYISYSYSPNYNTKYKHVWYQTPHFTLTSRGNPSNFVTITHLNYLLEKLNIARPANTTLDNISFNPLIQDSSYVKDELNLLVGYDVTMPLLEVFDLPGTFDSGTVDIKVVNPDEQEGIAINGYTYL